MEVWGMSRKRLKIQESAYRKVVQNAETAWPRECCGALLGMNCDRQERLLEAVPAASAETTSGADFFQIGARDMVAFHARAMESRQEILGFYHSHPDAPPVPSRADLPQTMEHDSQRRGATWPEHLLLIAGVQRGTCDEVRAYRLTAGSDGQNPGELRYEELELEIVSDF